LSYHASPAGYFHALECLSDASSCTAKSPGAALIRPDLMGPIVSKPVPKPTRPDEALKVQRSSVSASNYQQVKGGWDCLDVMGL